MQQDNQGPKTPHVRMTVKHDDVDLSPLSFDDDEGTQTAPASKRIVAFGPGEHHQEAKFTRKTHSNETGACRMKSFHGKYSEQGLEFLDNAVNRWLDNHPEVEVKFVTSTVGTFEGKIREPALVLNVWY